MDLRNTLLSFQAMRPSARQISTLNVPTTHWVCAAFPLPCLSPLFIPLCALLLWVLLPLLPTRLGGQVLLRLSCISHLSGGGCIRASAGTDTWVSGERSWGDVADNPRLGVKGWASHLSSANEFSLSPSLSLSEKVK